MSREDWRQMVWGWECFDEAFELWLARNLSGAMLAYLDRHVNFDWQYARLVHTYERVADVYDLAYPITPSYEFEHDDDDVDFLEPL